MTRPREKLYRTTSLKAEEIFKEQTKASESHPSKGSFAHHITQLAIEGNLRWLFLYSTAKEEWKKPFAVFRNKQILRQIKRKKKVFFRSWFKEIRFFFRFCYFATQINFESLCCQKVFCFVKAFEAFAFSSFCCQIKSHLKVTTANERTSECGGWKSI